MLAIVSVAFRRCRRAVDHGGRYYNDPPFVKAPQGKRLQKHQRVTSSRGKPLAQPLRSHAPLGGAAGTGKDIGRLPRQIVW
jgi:hypothetical protein